MFIAIFFSLTDSFIPRFAWSSHLQGLGDPADGCTLLWGVAASPYSVWHDGRTLLTEWWKRLQALRGQDGLTEIKVGYGLMKQKSE